MLEKIYNDAYEIYQEIDLVELFGQPIRNPLTRQQIGQAIIDTILSRTEKGKDIDGARLEGPYSTEYASSEVFALYGKSKNKINMKLTGDMLDNLDITESTPDKIKIGFTDKTQELKAANHNYGKTVPKREFFGVNRKELDSIKDEFEADLPTTFEDALEAETIKYAQTRAGTRRIGDLIGDLFDED